ncbi:MAG: hypothetical protein J7K48_08095 [Thermococcus sp.]|nr:hypothetical protein [Thermococcus sp.]
MFEQEKKMIRSLAELVGKKGNRKLAEDLREIEHDFPNLNSWQMDRLVEALRWTKKYITEEYGPGDPTYMIWDGIIMHLRDVLLNPLKYLSMEYGPFDALMGRFNKTARKSDLSYSVYRRIVDRIGSSYITDARIGIDPGKYIVISGPCEECNPRKIASIINGELVRAGYTPLTSAVRVRGGEYTYVAEVTGFGSPSHRSTRSSYYDEYRERMRRYGR